MLCAGKPHWRKRMLMSPSYCCFLALTLRYCVHWHCLMGEIVSFANKLPQFVVSAFSCFAVSIVLKTPMFVNDCCSFLLSRITQQPPNCSTWWRTQVWSRQCMTFYVVRCYGSCFFTKLKRQKNFSASLVRGPLPTLATLAQPAPLSPNIFLCHCLW